MRKISQAAQRILNRNPYLEPLLLETWPLDIAEKHAELVETASKTRAGCVLFLHPDTGKIIDGEHYINIGWGIRPAICQEVTRLLPCLTPAVPAGPFSELVGLCVKDDNKDEILQAIREADTFVPEEQPSISFRGSRIFIFKLPPHVYCYEKPAKPRINGQQYVGCEFVSIGGAIPLPGAYWRTPEKNFEEVCVSEQQRPNLLPEEFVPLVTSPLPTTKAGLLF